MKKLLVLMVIVMSMTACSDGLVVTNTYQGYYYSSVPVIIYHYDYIRPYYRSIMSSPLRQIPQFRQNNNYRSYGNRTFGNRQSEFGSRTKTWPGNNTGRFGCRQRLLE